MTPAQQLSDLVDALRRAPTVEEADRLASSALGELGVNADVGDDALQTGGDGLPEQARVVADMHAMAVARLKAEEDADAVRQRLATNEQIAELGSYDWHVPTDTNTWSDQLFRIYGYEPGAFNASYEKFLSLVHPDDRERIQQIHSHCMQTGEPFETEERIIRPDGEVRLLWTNGLVIQDDEGNPIRFVGTCRDITEQRRAEEEHAEAIEEAARHRERVREARLARMQSLELNDNVVQGLVTAKWLLAEGEVATAMNVVSRTLEAAQSMIDDLLVTQQNVLGAGDLVRSDAAPSFHLPDTGAFPSSEGGVRVVIADDSEDVRMLLRIRLERGGFEVVGEAEDGIQAVELAREHQPSAVILDLAMPRMDGLQAAAEIRAALPDARVIVLSAYGERVASDRAKEAGADIYLTKSATFEEVVESLKGLGVG